jgi:ribonuclease E
VLRGARMRMARKPSAVARELLRNFPKSGGEKRRRRRGKNGSRPQKGGGNGAENGAENGRGKESRDGAAPKVSDRTPEPKAEAPQD